MTTTGPVQADSLPCFASTAVSVKASKYILLSTKKQSIVISVLTNFIKEYIYPNALYTFLRSKFGTLQGNNKWESLEHNLKLSNVLVLPTNSVLLFQAKIYGKTNISIADPA